MARVRSQPAGVADDETAVAASPERRAYPVLSPLRRDGRRYGIGDEVELTEDEADELRPLGVIA